MDGDTNDSGDVLDPKAEALRLAQHALIKQDVMLSGSTNTQSPMSNMFPLPSHTVSLPTVSMATALAASSLSGSSLGGLHDNLFLSALPGLSNDTLSMPDFKAETSSLNQAALNTQMAAQQLLGQPQVPQLLVTSPPVQNQQSSNSVQQILIPISAGNGGQQLITIPVNSNSSNNGSQQIQLVGTPSGGIITANMSSSPNKTNNSSNVTFNAQNLTINANHTTTTSAESPLLQATTASNSILTTSSPTITNAIASTQPLITSPLLSSSSTQSDAESKQTILRATQSNLGDNTASKILGFSGLGNGIHQLITMPNGQIFAVGVSPSALSVAKQNQVLQAVALQQSNATSSALSQTALANAQISVSSSQAALAAAAQQLASQVAAGQAAAAAVANKSPVHTAVSLNQAVQAIAAANSQHQLVTTVVPPGMASLANISQLLPNTVSNSSEGTTIDGINLDEIKEFAKQFKIRRLSLGLTQTQVGQALSATEGPSYSQSAICRFEKLDITPKSAQKIKPVLERWMVEAEERFKNGVSNLSDFIGSEPSKKRKRRTSFTPQALDLLNDYFEKKTHPSGAEMTDLSGKLNYDREVIRVWFCNKRQALKNTIKKLKTHDSTGYTDS